MQNFGDITKVSGDSVPVADCVIGGSPCQDLSIAGRRAGLSGERSGLFMEQIRVIKEMREHDKATGRTGESVRPRFMVWENVPGALSSNKAEDFRIVLEETAKIADEIAVIPRPPKGKWTNAGCVVGDGWSIAWRIFDAQFWGVPQRRRRIALVADFGGGCAPEILFERESVPGDIKESGETRKGSARDIESGTYPAITRNMLRSAGFKYKAAASAGSIGYEVEIAPTLIVGQTSSVLQVHDCLYPEVAGTLCASGAGTSRSAGQCNETDLCVVQAVDCRNLNLRNETSGTLQAKESGGYSLNFINPVIAFRFKSYGEYQESETGKTLMSHDDITTGDLILQHAIARHLTPLECERLQGFPDGWTDIGEWTDSKGKVHKISDSARYKALGNSIALPPWTWVLKRLCSYYNRTPTMASLFDGIGGFPLIWERLNGKGSCLWASEIDEFPMAVTKRRFS